MAKSSLALQDGSPTEIEHGDILSGEYDAQGNYYAWIKKDRAGYVFLKDEFGNLRILEFRNMKIKPCAEIISAHTGLDYSIIKESSAIFIKK